MFDYRTCIVPDIKLRKKVYLWIAYSKEPPYLPVETASTSEELARKCKVSYSTVRACWSKYQSGKLKNTRYQKVKVGYEIDLEGGISRS